MLKNMSMNRLWIAAIAVCVLFVGGSFLYMQDARKEAERANAEIQAAEQARAERQKQQAAAAAAQKADTAQQGGHFHADGTWHADPHTDTVAADTASDAEWSHPVLSENTAEVAVDEATPSPAPYHPHDDLTPEEHERVHAEIEREEAKITDLTQLLWDNLADMRAGSITPEENLVLLEKIEQELKTAQANLDRLYGE